MNTKFFTFSMTVVNGQAAIATFERENEKAALSAHHSTIASAMADNNVTEVLCKVFNNQGVKLENDFYWRKNDE